MKDDYVTCKPTTLAKEGCNLKTINEGWDGKIIPTEPNALSDYLKGVSLNKFTCCIKPLNEVSKANQQDGNTKQA